MAYKNYKTERINDLREMLNRSADRWYDRAAFAEKRDGEYQDITFGEFRSDVQALGTALWSRGLAGKKIIVTGENCYNWARSYMSVICGLGVVVPVDRELNVEEMDNIADISGAAAIIYSSRIIKKVEKLKHEMQRISFDELDGLCEKGRALLAGGVSDYLEAPIDPEVMAALLFTSGTTGVSKGVMLSQKNICFNLMEMCQMAYIGPEDTFMSVLPLHHAYECTCGFLCQIYRGSKIAYCEGLKYIMKNLKEAKPTIILCVPQLIEVMYNKIWSSIRKNGMEKKVRAAISASNAIRRVGIDLRRGLFEEVHKNFGGELRMMISGGAPVDPVILKGMRDLGILAIQGYGLTECAPLAAVNRDKFYNDASAGLATPNAQLDIVNVQSDGTGEIRFKGDNIMLGYYNDPEQTAEVLRDGWFYTGDLGFIDKHGFLHITGRKKNVIVTPNGKNIFPEELETYLNRDLFIAESVVVGIPDEEKAGAFDIVAIIVPDYEALTEKFGEGYTDDVINNCFKAAIDRVNETVQSYKHIKSFIIRRDEFPKNTSRKIKRMGLLEEAQAFRTSHTL